MGSWYFNQGTANSKIRAVILLHLSPAVKSEFPMIPLTPILKAELITIDDDIVRYRVHCDQCGEEIKGVRSHCSRNDLATLN